MYSTFIVVYLRIGLVDENSKSSEFSNARCFVLNGSSEIGAFVSPEGSSIANTFTILQRTDILYLVSLVIVWY